MTVIAGYCKLCRSQELKRHGKLVRGIWHKHACRVAGCKHPSYYSMMPALAEQAKKFREFRKNSLEKNSG